MVTNMKKTYMIVLFVAVIAAMIPTLVIADDIIEENKADSYITELSAVSFFEDDLLDSYFAGDGIARSTMLNDSGPHYITIRGKWGSGKDPDFDGNFGGRITARMTQTGKRIGVFRGLYNKTGEDEKYSIVGIMKKGYFNGKITIADGEYKLTGLYYVDQENQLLKMQWMIPRNAGWAIARIQLP